MGLGSFLFGGQSVMDTSTPQIRDIGTALANYDPGLGAAGKLGKNMLKLIRAGRYMDLPEVMFARAQGSRDLTEMLRGLRMSGQSTGIDPRQLAGMEMKGTLANQNQTGMHVLGAAANAAQLYGQMYSLARGQRIDSELQGKMAGADILQRGRQVVQNRGLFDKIASVWGALGPLAGGIPGLSSSSGGSGFPGRYAPRSGSPTIPGPSPGLGPEFRR